MCMYSTEVPAMKATKNKQHSSVCSNSSSKHNCMLCESMARILSITKWEPNCVKGRVRARKIYSRKKGYKIEIYSCLFLLTPPNSPHAHTGEQASALARPHARTHTFNTPFELNNRVRAYSIANVCARGNIILYWANGNVGYTQIDRITNKHQQPN